MRKKRVVLVTGGPTRAYFDDVRYLSNFSSGKTAFEICKELIKKNVEVIAIIGPTNEPFESLPLKKYFAVETNDQMLEKVIESCEQDKPCWGIFAAAVLDFVPLKRETKKVSSKKKKWTIELKPAPKIIDEVKKKFKDMNLIGFKLQTRKEKNFDKELFAEKIIKEKKIFGLCVNFLEEVSTKKHSAFLVNSKGEKKTVHTKKEIAQWISTQITKD